MEEVPVQTDVANSGAFAKKYASSLLVKIFAFVAMAYAGLSFYSLFMQLKESGFDTPFWFFSLAYIFGYVFICVGLFSIIGKNRDSGKVISELHAVQIGFAVLALSNAFNIGNMLYSYFTYYQKMYSFWVFIKRSIFAYYFVDYIAAILSCIFAILLIRSVIGAIKGDPAGIVMPILIAIFTFAIAITWIVFFIIVVGSSITQEPMLAVSFGTRILLALLGCACALYWIPFAKKTNDHIFMNEPEEAQETDNGAEPEQLNGENNVDVQPGQEDGAEEIQGGAASEEPIEEEAKAGTEQ